MAMPVFAYSASDAAEQILKGTLIADSPAEGRERLRAQGLRLLDFGEAGPSRTIRLPGRTARRRPEEIAELARSLALLLRVGTPAAEALEVLSRGKKGTLQNVLQDLRDRLGSGVSLSDAMARHPRWFDTLFLSAVRTGEITGHLEESLGELSLHLRAHQALHRQLVAALTYPLIVLSLGIGVVIFLMTLVIPQLLEVLVAAGRPLPASTRFLKSLSDLLIHRWPLLLASLTGAAVLVAFLVRTPRGRRTIERLLLALPIAGSLLQKSVVARFAQQMALLLRTGIPFVEAVATVASLARWRTLQEELRWMVAAVESGRDIAPCMAGSRVFPPVAAHLVAVGQNSGELPTMLTELRNRYDTELQIAIGRFAAALEPLLVVLLAAGVGFVVFACLMPILEATRAMA